MKLKKMIAVLFIMITTLAVCTSAFAYDFEDDSIYEKFKGQNITINVYNWGQYIADGSDDSMNIVKEFENLTGIKVNYTTYPTNEEMYAKIKSGGGQYDVIVPSDYMIGKMIDEDMLEKLNFDNIPNYKNVDEQFVDLAYDPNNEYSVPYFWGTVGIIYNTTMVDGEPDSWDILWDEKYKGKILMFNNERDAFGIAQKKLGYSFNDTSEDKIRAAAEELRKQKPLVQAYVMDEVFDKMIGGEAALAVYYSGDYLTMVEDNPDLAYVVPKEGTNFFVDAMCIPKGVKNKEAAELFINFMMEAEVAAENALFVGYPTPNAAAFDLLPEDVQGDEVSYPSDAVMAKSEVFATLDTKTSKLMNDLWIEIKSVNQSDNNWIIPALIIACAVIVVALIIFRQIKKKKEY